MAMRTALVFLLLCICCCRSTAQSLVWVNQLEGPGDGDGHAVKVAPNGNVYVTGSFNKTIDLDPSAAVYNITSHGQRDIFLACYSATGNFLWGFGVGGNDNDYAKNIAVDKNSNVIIVGQFRGSAIDFDPGASTQTINANGWTDGFAAKYTSTGNLSWAHAIGGTGDFDDVQSAATDASGNVYIGGDFHRIMDIDPSPAVNNYLNGSSGTAFLIKYNPSGQLIWGFNFGGGGGEGTDNAVWGMVTDNNGFIYLAGCYQGPNADFDPTSASAVLSATGAYDGYLAKYSVNGTLQYVADIKGGTIDQAIDIALDANSNIYLVGYTESAGLTFNNGHTASRPAGSAKSDVFIARYNNNGKCQWGHIIGGAGTDFGWGIVVANNNVYCTGYFQQTVDFDPSINTENLTSKGGNDIFMARYDPNGNYTCSFSVGDTAHDNAYKIAADAAGYLYLGGFFSPSQVSFGPFSAPPVLNAKTGMDIYLAKYNWAGMAMPPDGYLVGDTVCEGDEAFLKFVSTSGDGPFMITYSDGTQTYTENNVNSGQVLSLANRPNKTTTYVLTRIKSKAPCTPAGMPNKGASVLVYPRPGANAGEDTSVCPGARIKLHGSGGIAYEWFPGAGLSAAYIPDPEITVNSETVLHLAVVNEYGCHDTGAVTISLVPADFNVKEINDVCIGDTIQLLASGGEVYEWSPVDSLYPAGSATPFAWPQQSRDYTVFIKDTVCGRSVTLNAKVLVHPLPDVRIVTAKDVDCGLGRGQLGAAGAVQYVWSPANTLSDPGAQATYATPSENTVYTVTGTDVHGCVNTDTATIKVFEGMGRLFAPDAFTPNNDGKNDCFHVNIPGEVWDYDLVIVNRWGQVVFHTHNIADCWDGTYNGSVADLGTYFYSYKGTSSICDHLTGKGSVQLVR